VTVTLPDSFNFGLDSVGIAWKHFLLSAVHDEVHIFEHNRPNEGVLSIRLYNRAKDATSTEHAHFDRVYDFLCATAIVGIANSCFTDYLHSQCVCGGLGYHQMSGAGVNNSFDTKGTHLIGRNVSGPRPSPVIIVR
jgi:hypothetical protein